MRLKKEGTSNYCPAILEEPNPFTYRDLSTDCCFECKNLKFSFDFKQSVKQVIVANDATVFTRWVSREMKICELGDRKEYGKGKFFLNMHQEKSDSTRIQTSTGSMYRNLSPYLDEAKAMFSRLN